MPLLQPIWLSVLTTPLRASGRNLPETLTNGRDADSNGPVDQDGRPGWGGAIYCSGGNLELIDCQFTDNHVLGGSATVSNQATNTIHYGGGGYGGAIYCENGGLWATNSLFANNSSTGGQGARWDTRYSAPGADAFGGAIFCTNSICTLLGVRLTNNLVQAGALNGYWSLDGSASGQMPLHAAAGDGLGGGIYSFGRLTLINCTLATNSADGGDGLPSDPWPYGAASGAGYGGALFSGRGTVSLLNVTMGDNGGPTPTLGLLTGSPALDAGDDSASPPTDQRGVGRPCGAHSGRLYSGDGQNRIGHLGAHARRALAEQSTNYWWAAQAPADLLSGPDPGFDQGELRR
jgi:hypothetical protein